jgi:hypothetical protein
VFGEDAEQELPLVGLGPGQGDWLENFATSRCRSLPSGPMRQHPGIGPPVRPRTLLDGLLTLPARGLTNIAFPSPWHDGNCAMQPRESAA